MALWRTQRRDVVPLAEGGNVASSALPCRLHGFHTRSEFRPSPLVAEDDVARWLRGTYTETRGWNIDTGALIVRRAELPLTDETTRRLARILWLRYCADALYTVAAIATAVGVPDGLVAKETRAALAYVRLSFLRSGSGVPPAVAPGSLLGFALYGCEEWPGGDRSAFACPSATT